MKHVNKVVSAKWIKEHVELMPATRDLKFIEYTFYMHAIEALKKAYKLCVVADDGDDELAIMIRDTLEGLGEI